MRAEHQRQVIERVLAHLADGGTDTGPFGRRVGTGSYTREDRFHREGERVFRSQPIVVAPAARLARPGDFVTAEVLGVPVLVCRDEERRLRGFYNVCRHRGTRLVNEPFGSRRTVFVCPYHAWSYAADGRLLKVTHEGCFPGLDAASYGLRPLEVAEAAGLVFVRLAGDGALDARAYLGGFLPDLEALGLAQLHPWTTDDYRGRANWKVLVEGGLEAYHFRYLHSRSIASSFHDNVFVWDAFGPHQRVVLPRRSIGGLRDLDPDQWSLREHAHLVYLVFPNTVLLVQHDHVMVIQMWPRSVSESHVTLTMLIPDEAPAGKAAAHWEKNRQITLTTLKEDFDIGQSAYGGIASGGLEHLTLGRSELGIAAFHDTIDALI